MLTILVHDAPPRVNCFKRLYRRLFWPSVVLEERKSDGLTLRYVFCNPYRPVHWRRISNICGEVELLLPDDVLPPARSDLSPIFTELLHGEAAGQAALDVLTMASPDPRQCRLLLYDREGEYSRLVRPLSELCNEMLVVTGNEEAYEELDEVLADTGKPIRVSSEMPDSRFGVVVAPGGFEHIVRVEPGTVVFTSGKQNLPLNGVVYYEYLPAIPEGWRRLCPACISWKRFRAAMLEAGKRENLFQLPILGYRQRICTDPPERVAEYIHSACTGAR